jgi:hypothetical protein
MVCVGIVFESGGVCLFGNEWILVIALWIMLVKWYWIFYVGVVFDVISEGSNSFFLILTVHCSTVSVYYGGAVLIYQRYVCFLLVFVECVKIYDVFVIFD